LVAVLTLGRAIQSTALISIFFGQRACKKVPERFGKVAAPVKNVAVVGAGLMGAGIAEVSALPVGALCCSRLQCTHSGGKKNSVPGIGFVPQTLCEAIATEPMLTHGAHVPQVSMKSFDVTMKDVTPAGLARGLEQIQKVSSGQCLPYGLLLFLCFGCAVLDMHAICGVAFRRTSMAR
jgi:hypothetical protein